MKKTSIKKQVNLLLTICLFFECLLILTGCGDSIGSSEIGREELKKIIVTQRNKSKDESSSAAEDKTVTSSDEDTEEVKASDTKSSQESAFLETNTEKKQRDTSSESEDIQPSISDEKKMIVCIDPGHSSVVEGGTEPIGPGSSEMKAKDSSGTTGIVTKIPEYKLTLALSKKLQRILEAQDGKYEVVLTHTSNKVGISCKERANVANKCNADIFVRIHADGVDTQDAHGASVHYPTENNPFVAKYSRKSEILSKILLDSLCKETGAVSRGMVGRDDLSGSNWAKMPVSLIEVGFMTNPEEDKLLAQDSYREKIAEGIAKGIDKYYKRYF